MISVITCSIDPQKFAAVKASYAGAFHNEKWELIGIHDAKSLSEGYMRGFAASKGEIVIFSHDDVELLTPTFEQRLMSHLSRYEMVGVAGTTRVIGGAWSLAGHPYLYGQVVHVGTDGSLTVSIYNAPRPVVGNIQGLDGQFIAVRREVMSKVSFDPVNFDGFHLYDIDFSYAAYRAGVRIAVACDINFIHASVGNYDQVWQKYADRFDRKWFSNVPRPSMARFGSAGVKVNTRAEALGVMNPPHWRDPAEFR
jgi:GT2 family glycosyltransferase